MNYSFCVSLFHIVVSFLRIVITVLLDVIYELLFLVEGYMLSDSVNDPIRN